MKLKEYILSAHKEDVYAFYQRINSKAEDYEKITRNDIYHNIISLYKDDPEIILRLCSMEEIQILKNLLENKVKKKENGYIDYLLFQDLKHNYLVLESDQEYYIPEDLINCVKMAMNLLDEQAYSVEDVMISVIIGISRVYNTLLIDDVLLILEKYNIYYDEKSLKKYIEHQPRIMDKVKIVRYQKKDYFVSLEFLYYEDVLKLRQEFKVATYSLEEIISFGKYKLNLFDEKVLYFLNFLEIHLDPLSIHLFLNDLIFYCGFDLNQDSILLQICDNITELYQETQKIVSYFPVWIYFGNSIHQVDDQIILPNKNDPCICGSGKKFKNCCLKKFK